MAGIGAEIARLAQADPLGTEFGNGPRSPEIRWPGVLEDILVAGGTVKRRILAGTCAG